MREKAFNLLYEPWIMVLNLEGETEEVSLLTVLERAHEFRCLAGELPTQDVAVLRLILATLYATFTRADGQGNRKPINNSPEALERWKSLWELKRFPLEPIKTRLCHYEERFFLFHPERPFYQVAGLDRGTNYTAAKLLGNLSESGNKVRLFPVRTGDAKHFISYAEAARWLLYLNAFDDTSSKPSVRGQKMLSPGAGWLGKLGIIYANGTNLFETLMLNFVLINDNGEPWSNGHAVWELDEPRTDERVEIVLPQDWLTILTLQSRRLLLQREGSYVVGYRLLGGDFFLKENAFTEQMTLWRKDSREDVYLPKRHDPSRQLWRDLSAFLADGEGLRKPGIVRWLSIIKDQGHINHMVTLQIAGVKYGDKDFFVTDVFQDSLTINANMVSQLGQGWVTQIIRLLSITEDCVKLLSVLAADLAKASGDSDSLHHTAGAGNGSAAKAEAYFRLDMPFRKWLANIDPMQTDIAKAEQEWKNIVRGILLQLGEEMTHQSGEKAIIGRWVKGRLYTAPAALAKFRSKIIRTIEKGG
ncbi:MAG: type I-E CRISPR-associated protein Cse1/CasA [Peptococcaceae bacterium]|nr:type I-E CRISPR-associated protein Cse1/CasA [Peptococcaceae bacterium]